MGLTTVNLLVKYAEISSPRDAFSAIASADSPLLRVFGIALLLLFRRFPRGDEMVVFSLFVMPDLKYDGTEASSAPTNGAELFRVIVLLVNQVSLLENLLRLFQADTVFLLYGPAFQPVELKTRITVISHFGRSLSMDTCQQRGDDGCFLPKRRLTQRFRER